jgi:HD-GYP domain-containing protein (c-di-GMP phosphodiesterase class II)
MKQKQSFKNYSSDLEKTFIDTLRILIAAIDSRDDYTFGHSTRVAKMSLLIGRRLNLDTESLKKLQMACLFHDVGKIRLSDSILNKNLSLDEQEIILMNKHPEHGSEILGLADSLRQYIPSILHHHEWYDGNGYPAGIKGEKIPVFSAIISLTDAYDAMTSKRPYRDVMSKEAAVEELQRCRGTQFNPRLTDIFVEVLYGLWKQEES